MPLPRVLARFNRRVANPIVRGLAGRLSPLGLVAHRGRHTGRQYATPVLTFATDDGLVVALFYGAGCDWVRNVLRAGRADVTRSGVTHPYSQPLLIGVAEALQLLPRILRVPARMVGLRHGLRLTILPGG